MMNQDGQNESDVTHRGWWFAQAAVTLMAVWVLLSGKLDALHLGLGVVGALAIAASFYRRRRGRPFPFWRFMGYLPWQLWQILVSNIRVTKVALSRKAAIQPSFVERDPLVRSERAMTLLGCGITLTPGTLTVEIEQGRCLVHALDDVSAGDIEQDVMAHRVAAVFGEPIGGSEGSEGGSNAAGGNGRDGGGGA